MKKNSKEQRKILTFKLNPCCESSITLQLALAENQTLYNLAEVDEKECVRRKQQVQICCFLF